MPSRPNRFVMHQPTYQPAIVDDFVDKEILPVISCNVNSLTPTSNFNPPTAIHNANLGTNQNYGLLRFDLRGLHDGMVQIAKAMLTWGAGGPSDVQTVHVGIIDEDVATWTQLATWNTRDGTNAWAGGAGSFRNPGTEVSWVTGKMPGVSTGDNYVNLTQGTWPPGCGIYHPKYDTGLTAPVLDALASLFNAALASSGGFLNIYIYTTGDINHSILPGNYLQQSASRMRLFIWEMAYSTTLGYFGPSDEAMFKWPPLEAYESVHPVNARVVGYERFNMTSIRDGLPFDDDNYHGGMVNVVVDTEYSCAPSDTWYVLMEFNLQEFAGVPFEKVILRLTGGCDAGAAGTNNQLLVGQFKDSWVIGDGISPNTSGPTFDFQEKTGSVPWPSGNPSLAAALDTVGQAETTCTYPGHTQWAGVTAGGSNHIALCDITEMAKRAMTTYGGKLRLRLRATQTGGFGSNVVQGPTSLMHSAPTTAKNNAETNGNLPVGAIGWPKLFIKTTTP